MKLSDLAAGEYRAIVEDRGVRENRNTPDNPLEAWAKLRLLDHDIQIEWKGYLLKKGTSDHNNRTFKCLAALGCLGKDVLGWLNSPVTDKIVLAQVIEEIGKNEHEGRVFKNVAWINELREESQADVIDRLAQLGFGGEPKMPF